jgi:hypothetical protein
MLAYVLGFLLISYSSASTVVRKSEEGASQPLEGIASFAAELSSDAIYLRFSVDSALAANVLMVTFLRNKGEKCPSFLYWFKKDQAEAPAYSVAAACDETEGTGGPRLRHKLAVDWTRTADRMAGKYWEFEGRIRYPWPVMDGYQFQSFQWVRFEMSRGEMPGQTKEIYFKLL